MAYKAPSASTAVTGCAKFDAKDVLVTAGLVQHKCGLQPGPHNLGLTYAAGTLTVCSASQAALSATNPGYVTLQSKTPGKLVTVPVVANQFLTDGAAGTTATQRFALTSGVNWASDLPFFLHAVLDDSETAISFMITRNPAATVAPAAANIGKSGAVVNGIQGDFFAMGNPTVADYEGNPCLCIGSFRAQFVGATNSWTISALAANDSVGQFNESTVFLQPTGTNGSAVGAQIQANAGTVPTFATQRVSYTINRYGLVHCVFVSGACNNIPAGAQVIKLTLPYQMSSSTMATNCFFGRFYNATNGVYTHCSSTISTAPYNVSIIATGGTAPQTNAAYAANFELNFEGSYQAF